MIVIKKDAEKSRQSLQQLKQLEESEDHDVKRNGKNQQELGGNDRGSYKHRAPQGPPQAPQPPPQRQQFDANPSYCKICKQIKEQTIYHQLTSTNTSCTEDKKFKRGSKLRAYLSDNNIARKSNYLLIEILVVIKDTVIQQQLYDPKNKAVVMCNPSLSETLGAQDYHVSKLRGQILQHLVMVKRQDWRDNLNRYTNEYTIAATHPAEFFARHIIQLVNVTSSLFVSQEARFVVKPNLLTILRTESRAKLVVYTTRRWTSSIQEE